MAHYALVDSSGNVVNTIVWDGAAPYVAPAGLTAVVDDSALVGPGYTYAGGSFTPPVVTMPAITRTPSCALWQLQAVMTPAQWTAAQAAIAALNNAAVSAFFAHGTNVIPATSTTLLSLGEAIGLTADQITALVTEAAAIAIP